MPTVRPATEADVEALVGLLGALFRQEAEFSADATTQRRGLGSLISDGERAVVLLAEQEGVAVGMLSIQVVVSTALGGRVALLEDMVIHPGKRGEAIGSVLLRGGIEQAEMLGCRRITLLTDADNVKARRFYGRHGFVDSTMVPMRREL